MAEVAAVERRDPTLQPVTDHAPPDIGDTVRGEPEVLEDRPGRRRRAEVVEPDDRPLVADPALPAERHSDLDADALAHIRREDRVAIRLVLRLEALPAGQRDHASRDPVVVQGPTGGHRELELGPGADDDQSGRATSRVAEHVAAPGDALAGLLGGPFEHRELLAGQRERDWSISSLDGERPCGRGLVRVAWADEPQVRDRPQRRVLLHGLVRRAVLAETDRVVRPD